MYNKKEVLQKVDMLYSMWKKGSLGGEVMPEDANPHLDKSSVENYLYFTLPKQTEIWLSLCKTFVELYGGDIRKLFDSLDNDVDKIKNFIQKENKKKFPYLSGTKICNYWLYVIYQYTDRKYKNINQLTVAPDTHVIQATHRLGLITDEELNKSDVQLTVVDRWNELFKETKYKPIDIHTPLWLWSRNGFKEVK